MNIAIIPARGGSKRLPKKNIKIINGRPLIEWTINAAIRSNMFDEVHVNTDCEKIAEIAISAGATVPFIRKKDLATDQSSTRDVILDHFKYIKLSHKITPKTLCLLQPTSPLRDHDDIIASYEILEHKNANSIVSVCELEHQMEICNSLDSNKSMNKFIDQSDLNRPQENKKKYRINGAIYILDSTLKGDLNNLYNIKTFPYIMPNEKSIDIDTEFDFSLAEHFMNINNKYK